MSNITKLLILLAIGLILAAASIWFVGGKKKNYETLATIKARPYQLFPYLVEPESKIRWIDGLISEQVVVDPADESADAGAIKENAELDTVFEIDNEPVSFRGSIIRFAQNEFASFKYRNEEMHRTLFFRLKGKGDVTELEYRRIVRLDGMRRFASVFKDDNNQSEVEQEIQKLVSLVESEVDNSIPDPNQNRPTIGIDTEEETGNENQTQPKESERSSESSLQPTDSTEAEISTGPGLGT